MPRSVIDVMRAESDVTAYPLPERIARATTWLVWRTGHQSVTLDALRKELLQRRR